FSGQLYGQPLTVDLVEQVRGTQVFSDAEALKNQIEKDLSVIRRLANSDSDR
ncbi:MAG: bifunctional riboflavin kinase/FAD synthetase, partial [Planctomycetaceae bacterium]|nr:bifunctional riboflavin kinase/FAD synthetase [Planctomycetaceae bacterium]